MQGAQVQPDQQRGQPGDHAGAEAGQVGVRELSGPVGIVQLMNDVGTESATTADAVYSLAYLTAFIAVNLAVMNLLPLPALDGGRLFFLLITAFVAWAFKKQLDPKYEGYVHTAGFVLLLGLVLRRPLISFNRGLAEALESTKLM